MPYPAPSARRTAASLLAAALLAALVMVLASATAARAGGSDAPTPYAVTAEGIALPDGQTFPAHGHVNIRWTGPDGRAGIHFDPNNGHPGGVWIGTTSIPWTAFGVPAGACVTWVQVSLYDEHYGEGGQPPVCPPGATPTPEPTSTPTPTEEPTWTPGPTPQPTSEPSATPEPSPQPSTTPAPSPQPSETSSPEPSASPSPSAPSVTPSSVASSASPTPVPKRTETSSASAELAATGVGLRDVLIVVGALFFAGLLGVAASAGGRR